MQASTQDELSMAVCACWQCLEASLWKNVIRGFVHSSSRANTDAVTRLAD